MGSPLDLKWNSKHYIRIPVDSGGPLSRDRARMIPDFFPRGAYGQIFVAVRDMTLFTPLFKDVAKHATGAIIVGTGFGMMWNNYNNRWRAEQLVRLGIVKEGEQH